MVVRHDLFAAQEKTLGRGLVFAGWAIFVGLTWGPVTVLFAQAAVELAAGNNEAWALVLPSTRRAMLLARSLGMGLAVATLSGLVGGLAALAFLKWVSARSLPRWMGAGLVAVLTAWVIAPPYVHALAALQTGALLGSTLALPDLPSWASVILVQTLALLPLTAVAALVGLISVERDQVEAGLLIVPEGPVLRRMVLPLAGPILAVGTGAVFVLAVLDANTPSLFGVPSYAMEVVAEFSASHMAWRASLVALPLILVTGLVVASASALLANNHPGLGRASAQALTAQRALLPWPIAARAALAGGASYGVLLVALLFVGVTLWQLLPGLIWEVRRDLWLTLANALAAAVLALGPAAVIAWHLTAAAPRTKLFKVGLWAIVLLPLALPPGLIGAGFAALLTSYAPIELRSMPLIPAFAQAARFLPLAVLLVTAQMGRINPLLVDAARLQRAPGLARWLCVDGPLAAPGLWAGFALVFCASIGELEATLMTAAPGAGLLSMRIFNYLHYGVSETVAALGLVLVALIWIGVSFGLRLAKRGSA